MNLAAGNPTDHPGIHLLVGFGGVTFEQELKLLMRDFHIGGIVLFKRNIQSPEQLHSLLSDAQGFAVERLGRRLWVAIDQEGGPVQRFGPGFFQLPSAHDLSLGGADSVEEWGRKSAMDLRRMGIQINLAPVLDVFSREPSHFMEARCLGSDPVQVARLGRLWIQALQGSQVSATAKHFPGLGRAESDPHQDVPVIHWHNESEMERDLLPFREAVRAGVHCVMTSHSIYPFLDPRWPATLSPKIGDEWLRRRLGFEGVLLSDDMDMAAISGRYTTEEIVRQGFASTVDFLLSCQHPENIEPLARALTDGCRRESRMRLAHEHSLKRLERLGGHHA